MQKEKTSHTDTSETLFLNLQKIFRCLSFGRSLQAKAPTLSVTQMRILSFFNERDVVYISEISRVLGMSLQSVNNLVHRLEVSGYVERSKNSSDKRLSDIRLTAKGRMGFQAFRNEQFEVIGELLAGIEDTEQRLLTATVEATAVILEKAVAKKDIDKA
jgi:DNA-binding MarR family transcriptional regulator